MAGTDAKKMLFQLYLDTWTDNSEVNMSTLILRATLYLFALLLASSVRAEGETIDDLAWEFGPTEGIIGTEATIAVPEGYVFLGAEDTKKLMVMMENIPSEHEYVFAPDDLRWFAVFEFDPVGYIEDNEPLDAEVLLETVSEGTRQGNIERRKRGWSTMSILGWKFQPRYDAESNLLEWAFLAKSDNDDSEIINYNTRLLGRSGVMQVVLVADPLTLDESVHEFKQAIGDYTFVAGERYADFREGDRVAEYGLAALIAGGAAAVATKKGLWGVIAGFFAAAWKFILAAVVGAGAWLGSRFKRDT